MRLSVIAGRIAKRTGLRHLLFLAAALFSILLIGYHFGTFDQVVHIPFLKADADPALYPGDAFVALRKTPNSFFWYFFIPFYRWGLLEVSLFAAHFLATYLTFWAVWRLSLTLFADALAGLLAVLAFSFPHFGFLGFPVIEFSLLNRGFVLPFLLFAIDLYVRRRHGAAFLLLGLAANLHPLSAGMVTAMLLFSTLLAIRQAGFAGLVRAGAGWLLGATPVLMLWMNNRQPVDWSLRPEWLSIVARGILYQVFYPFSTIPYIMLLTLGGFSAVGLWLVAGGARPTTDSGRDVRRMLVAAGLIFAVGICTATFLPVTILIELQLNRVSLFMLIFAYLYFANSLAQEFRSGKMDRSHWALLAGSFIVSAVPVFPLAVWGLLRWWKPGRLKWGGVAAAVAGSFGVFMAVALAWGIWSPGISIFARQTSWLEVQAWARENTPVEAVFITPPEKGGLYEAEWRVFSERSSVASVIDLQEVALAPQYLETWRERFERLAPGALEQFNGNYLETDAIARRAFYSLSDQALMQAAALYEAGYLVVEKPHVRDFLLLYENEDYIVYQLP